MDSGKGIALFVIIQSSFNCSANTGQRQLARRWCLKMRPTSLCAKVFPAELSPDDGRQALSNSEWKAISKWTHKIKSVKQVLRANCVSLLQSDSSPKEPSRRAPAKSQILLSRTLLTMKRMQEMTSFLERSKLKRFRAKKLRQLPIQIMLLCDCRRRCYRDSLIFTCRSNLSNALSATPITSS